MLFPVLDSLRLQLVRLVKQFLQASSNILGTDEIVLAWWHVLIRERVIDDLRDLHPYVPGTQGVIIALALKVVPGAREALIGTETSNVDTEISGSTEPPHLRIGAL